jgi:hypothetical protein
MNILHKKAFGGLLFLVLVMAALLFIPAWTFDYWQAWTFLAVYFALSLADHPLSHEKGCEAPGATDARGTDRREGTDSKNHHGFHVAGIYRPHCVPRTRSSLRMVARRMRRWRGMC